MFYLFFGENDYEIKKTVEELTQGGEKEIFDYGSSDNRAAYPPPAQLVRQDNLFGQKRFCILKHYLSEASPEGQKAFLTFLTSQDLKLSQNLVFWEDKKPDQRRKLTLWLLKNAKTQEFKPLSKPQLRNWIKKMAGEAGIEGPAVEELLNLHADNQWILENELEKLTLYTLKRAITLGDVKKLCVSSLEQNIFEFTDAIGNRRSKEALLIYKRLLDERADLNFVFAMIVRQFRLLILAKEGGLKGQHPFVIQKVSGQARLWQTEELKKIYARLLEIDYLSKTDQGNLIDEIFLLLDSIA